MKMILVKLGMWHVGVTEGFWVISTAPDKSVVTYLSYGGKKITTRLEVDRLESEKAYVKEKGLFHQNKFYIIHRVLSFYSDRKLSLWGQKSCHKIHLAVHMSC